MTVNRIFCWAFLLPLLLSCLVPQRLFVTADDCTLDLLQDATPLLLSNENRNVNTSTPVHLITSTNGNHIGIWNERRFHLLIRGGDPSDNDDSGSLVYASSSTTRTFYAKTPLDVRLDNTGQTVVLPQIVPYVVVFVAAPNRFVKFGEILYPLQGHLSLTTDGSRLAVGSELYDLSNKTTGAQYDSPVFLDTPDVPANLTVTALSGDGRYLAVAPNKNKVHLYQHNDDSNTYQWYRRLPVPSYLSDIDRIYISKTGQLIVVQTSASIILLFEFVRRNGVWTLVAPYFTTYTGLVATKVQLDDSGPNPRVLLQTSANNVALFEKKDGEWEFHQRFTTKTTTSTSAPSVFQPQDVVLTGGNTIMAVGSDWLRTYRFKCPSSNSVPSQSPSRQPQPTGAPTIRPTKAPTRLPSGGTLVVATLRNLEWTILFDPNEEFGEGNVLSSVYVRRWESTTEQSIERWCANNAHSLTIDSVRTKLTIIDQLLWESATEEDPNNTNRTNTLLIRYDQTLSYMEYGGGSSSPLDYAILPFRPRWMRSRMGDEWQQSLFPRWSHLVVPFAELPQWTNYTTTQYHNNSKNASYFDNDVDDDNLLYGDDNSYGDDAWIDDNNNTNNNTNTTDGTAIFWMATLVIVGIVAVVTLILIVWCCCMVCRGKRMKLSSPSSSAGLIHSVVASPMMISSSPMEVVVGANTEAAVTEAHRDGPIFKDQVSSLPLADAVPLQQQPPPVHHLVVYETSDDDDDDDVHMTRQIESPSNDPEGNVVWAQQGSSVSDLPSGE